MKMGIKWKSNKNCLHPKQKSVYTILMGSLGNKLSKTLEPLWQNSHGAGLGEGCRGQMGQCPEKHCRQPNPQRAVQHPRSQAWTKQDGYDGGTPEQKSCSPPIVKWARQALGA